MGETLGGDGAGCAGGGGTGCCGSMLGRGAFGFEEAIVLCLKAGEASPSLSLLVLVVGASNERKREAADGLSGGCGTCRVGGRPNEKKRDE